MTIAQIVAELQRRVEQIDKVIETLTTLKEQAQEENA